MQHYNYLIIGGGMTADAAAHGIREIDSKGSIGLFGSEVDASYNRPPLTKSLWKGDSLESIWRHTETQKVDLYLGRTVQAIDVGRKMVTDDLNEFYTYDKLLLATGGTPRRFPFDGGQIIYFRTLADYRRLRTQTEKGQRFAVIGGGFIGSELAAALAMNHKEVVMIFPGSGICSRIFPLDLSHFLNDFYREKGVEVLVDESVSGIEQQGEKVVLRTSSKREIVVDGVVAGIGIEPNLEMARRAGVQIENGIVVDEFLRTTNPDIYAAGDVAAFYSPALAKRVRVEHEDNANTMGRQVGRNMAGASEPYVHLPFFYSDLFELGYEAVGELDTSLSIIVDWKEPYHEGIVYYQQEDQVRGVLLWNVFGMVDVARELIGNKESSEVERLKAKLAGKELKTSP